MSYFYVICVICHEMSYYCYSCRTKIEVLEAALSPVFNAQTIWLTAAINPRNFYQILAKIASSSQNKSECERFWYSHMFHLWLRKILLDWRAQTESKLFFHWNTPPTKESLWSATSWPSKPFLTATPAWYTSLSKRFPWCTQSGWWGSWWWCRSRAWGWSWSPDSCSSS